MFFYCPKCKKCFVNNCEDIIPKNSIEGKMYRTKTGIYHVKCDCGNYLAGYINFKPDSLALIDYARNYISKFNKGGRYYSRKYKLYIKKALNSVK